ncbi:hypothetical protein IWZ01DRAFT_42783 [Phyllosticta capitalensis]
MEGLVASFVRIGGSGCCCYVWLAALADDSVPGNNGWLPRARGQSLVIIIGVFLSIPSCWCIDVQTPTRLKDWGRTS